jgi:hypothetical protein
MQSENGADMGVLLEMLASRRIRAAVDEVVPVDGGIDLIGRLARQEVAGKAVIEFDREGA